MSLGVKCLLALALFALVAEISGYGYGSGHRRGGYERGRGASRGGLRWYFNKKPCELTLGMQYHRHAKYRHIRTIPSSCEKGHVDWYYPTGQVSLDFSDYWGSSQPFTICLIRPRADTQNITDVTDGYYPAKYNFQRPDQWSDGHVCIPSHGPRLRLVMDGGPRVTYHMSRMSYTKEDQVYGVTAPTPEPESAEQTTTISYDTWGSNGGTFESSYRGYGSYGRSRPKA